MVYTLDKKKTKCKFGFGIAIINFSIFYLHYRKFSSLSILVLQQ